VDHAPSRPEHDAGNGHDAKRRQPPLKRGFLLALALIGAIGFAALGVWQIERRAWKLDLIARVEARQQVPPSPLPSSAEWRSVDATDAYLRLTGTGRFDHGAETLVQAVTEQGAGFWVLTPFRTAQGVFLVNRGFVPGDHRDAASRPAGQLAGPATVTGLLRITEPGGGFLRHDDPAHDRWYSRDVAAIAAARHLGPVAPFFIDADATPNPGGWPVGGLTVIRFRNAHLVYALTWFGLAALCVAAFVRLLRDR
jgi:surfeit locus 1 family protein